MSIQKNTLTYKNPIVTEAPIFGIEYHNGYLFVIIGGGGQKFGLRNYLQIHKIHKDKISESSIEKIEFQDLPSYIKFLNKSKFFLICFESKSKLYSFDETNCNITEVKSYDILDSICILNFDIKSHLLVTGNSNGDIKLYGILYNHTSSVSHKDSQYSIDDFQIKHAYKAHNLKITDVVISDNGQIYSCSLDQTCKVWEVKNNILKLIHCLSFKINLSSEPYIVRNVILYNGYIYTLQSPMRGNSYITKWRQSDYSVVLTKSICTSVCSRMKRIGKTLIIGQVDGQIIHIDAESLEINFQKEYHLMDISSFAIVDNKMFFSAGADQMISSHIVRSKNILSIYKLILIVLLSVIVYGIKIRIEELNQIGK